MRAEGPSGGVINPDTNVIQASCLVSQPEGVLYAVNSGGGEQDAGGIHVAPEDAGRYRT